MKTPEEWVKKWGLDIGKKDPRSAFAYVHQSDIRDVQADVLSDIINYIHSIDLDSTASSVALYLAGEFDRIKNK